MLKKDKNKEKRDVQKNTVAQAANPQNSSDQAVLGGYHRSFNGAYDQIVSMVDGLATPALLFLVGVAAGYAWAWKTFC